MNLQEVILTVMVVLQLKMLKFQLNPRKNFLILILMHTKQKLIQAGLTFRRAVLGNDSHMTSPVLRGQPDDPLTV